jgi:hypothetical protein
VEHQLKILPLFEPVLDWNSRKISVALVWNHLGAADLRPLILPILKEHEHDVLALIVLEIPHGEEQIHLGYQVRHL